MAPRHVTKSPPEVMMREGRDTWQLPDLGPEFSISSTCCSASGAEDEGEDADDDECGAQD